MQSDSTDQTHGDTTEQTQSDFTVNDTNMEQSSDSSEPQSSANDKNLVLAIVCQEPLQLQQVVTSPYQQQERLVSGTLFCQ